MKIVKIELKNKHLIFFFSIRCHVCPKDKIPHIVHLTKIEKTFSFIEIVFLFLENFLFLDSQRPAETSSLSFLDLPPCENVQNVQE
jgi:hypothetical protein